MLGYNVLFQDVDIVWFKDPQLMIGSMVAEDKDADIYMQHDGNHAEFYAPYSGNTGFYHVRNTKQTQVSARVGPAGSSLCTVLCAYLHVSHAATPSTF